MAHAGARFSFAVLEALNGKQGVVECGYIASHDTAFNHFATPLLFGVCCLLDYLISIYSRIFFLA